MPGTSCSLINMTAHTPGGKNTQQEQKNVNNSDNTGKIRDKIIGSMTIK